MGPNVSAQSVFQESANRATLIKDLDEEKIFMALEGVEVVVHRYAV